jgi:hypothetical protein
MCFMRDSLTLWTFFPLCGLLGIISLLLAQLKRIGSQGQHWPMENCGLQAKRTRLPKFNADTSRLSHWNVNILGPKFNASNQSLRQTGLENSRYQYYHTKSGLEPYCKLNWDMSWVQLKLLEDTESNLIS